MILPTKRCWCCQGVLVAVDHAKGYLWQHESMSDLIVCRERRRSGAEPGRKPPPPAPWPPDPPNAA